MWIAFRFTLMTLVLFGLIYPLLMTGLGQLFFPSQANGSLLTDHTGQVVGSELIGQAFIKPEYFHSRLSINHHDGMNSGGSNWGATNRKLIEQVLSGAKRYQQENHVPGMIPIDAVTASGSGLDPHISLANALAQAPRIAATRGQDESAIRRLVLQHSESSVPAQAPYVNVLQLNLALIELQ